MNCVKCGSALVAGARFCGECGTPVVEQKPVGAVTGQQKGGVRSAEALAQTFLGGPGDGTTEAARAMAEAVRLANAGGRPVTPPVVESAEAPPAPVRLDPNNLVGVVLNARYRVISRIGEGGFGAVYKGDQIAMNRECAIKVLHPRMAKDPQVVGRFRREAQAASMLRDPHTVATYDFDQTPEGILYMAMELLHGRSLHVELAAGAIPYRRVAHILSGVLESLAEAHAHGIVHRDIKPENIYLETRGTDRDYAKVLDFGIAKIVSGDGHTVGPQLTAAGQTLGTIEYMSPEQLMGLSLDGRSDLYALGNLAYEMLTGQLPFSHLRTPGELITAHLRQVPRPPSEVRADLRLPRAIDQLVLRLLEKQRDNRWKSAAEVRAALQRIIASAPAESGLGSVAEAATQPDMLPMKPLAAIEEGALAESRPRRSQGPLYVAAGVVFLLVAAVAAWLLFMNKARAAEAPRAAAAAALPPPVRLVPAGFDGLLSLDLPALRAAAPQAAAGLMEAVRPTLAEVGVGPEQLGRVALGLSSAIRPGGPAQPAAVLIAEAPVDAKKLAAAAARLRPDDKFTPAQASGTSYARSPAGSYAVLGGGRVALGSTRALTAALALARGRGATPPTLVDGRAAPLLGRLGVAAGRGAPAFGWARLDDQQRQRLDARLPGLLAIEEVAQATAVSDGGADVKALGSCASPEGAQKAAEALRQGLAEARRDPMVALLGLGRLLDGIAIGNQGGLVTLSLHLTPAQLADLTSRLGSALSSRLAPPPPPDAAGAPPRVAPAPHG